MHPNTYHIATTHNNFKIAHNILHIADKILHIICSYAIIPWNHGLDIMTY